MSNQQKTPLARTLPLFSKAKAQSEIAKLGLGVPGTVIAVSGAIVTINFEVSGLTLPQVQMPLASAEYLRLPIQIGDKGVALPASFYLGGVSGLGGGIADDTQRGNLSTLLWFPIGSKNWSTPPGSDANTLALYGKTALLLLDSIAGNSSIKLTSSAITMTCAGHTIVINSTGVIIDGKTFLIHTHSDPQGGNTGPVN